MLSIGDLARHTRVSIRMLRHYDALGLVRPERVDHGTGHRWYAVSQIGRVNSLLALKDLGFTLDRCGAILDERVSVEELRELLRERRAELERQREDDSRRLAEIGRRLRSIERGLTMTNGTLRLTALPSLRLTRVGTEVNDTTEIAATAAILSDRLTEYLTAAGLPANSLRIDTYFGRPDGSKIDVAVGVEHTPGLPPADGVETVELPAEQYGASVIHQGPAGDIGDAWQTLDVVLRQQGLESYGVHRLVELDAAGRADHSADVQVELQCPVRAVGTGCE